jgi:flavin reductase (DIM6/NTAB) family NADH-FMN oxidoreductase RutF
MPPDLRGVMRNFATGVCVATTYSDQADGRRHDAVTINSLTSVSLDPPLVSLCLRLGSAFLADLLATKKWAISILPGDACDTATLLAQDRQTRAACVATLPASPGWCTGALVLDSASWLECVLWDSLDVGDHTLVIGEVVATKDHRPEPALVFLHGRYHVLDMATPDPPPGVWRISARRVAHFGPACGAFRPGAAVDTDGSNHDRR